MSTNEQSNMTLQDMNQISNKPKYKIGDVIHGWEVNQVKLLPDSKLWHYKLINDGNKLSGTEDVIDAVFANYAKQTQDIDG